MFYLGEEAVRQSAGLVLRDERIAETADAARDDRDELERARHPLPRRSPPNASTVYQDDLPYWAQNDGHAPSTRPSFKGLAAAASRRSTCGPSMAGPRGGRPTIGTTPIGPRAGACRLRRDCRGRRPSRLAARSEIALAPPETRKGGDLRGSSACRTA